MLLNPNCCRQPESVFLKFRKTDSIHSFLLANDINTENESVNGIEYAELKYSDFFILINKISVKLPYLKNKRVLVYPSERLSSIIAIAVLDFIGAIIILAEKNVAESRFGFDYVLNVDENFNFNLNLFVSSNTNSTTIEIPYKEKGDLVLFTSGTTSFPKGCVFSYSILHKRGEDSINALNLTKDDSYLLSLDLYHISGLMVLIRTFLSGGMIIVSEKSDDRTLFDDITNLHPSVISFVPTQLINYLNNGLKSYSEQRVLLLGGASIPKKYLDLALSVGFNIYCGYGSTETVAFILLFRYTGGETPDYLGYPIAGVQVSLVNLDGFEKENIGNLRVGEISRFLGYAGEPDLPHFETGDICEMQEDGSFRLLGRSTEFINTGGKKVNPKKIEDFLNSLELVRGALVFGIEDDYWGEKIVAVVEADEITEIEIISKCKQTLSLYEVPKQIIVVPQMEYTSVGKINKRATIQSVKSLLK